MVQICMVVKDNYQSGFQIWKYANKQKCWHWYNLTNIKGKSCTVSDRKMLTILYFSTHLFIFSTMCIATLSWSVAQCHTIKTGIESVPWHRNCIHLSLSVTHLTLTKKSTLPFPSYGSSLQKRNGELFFFALIGETLCLVSVSRLKTRDSRSRSNFD